MKGLSEAVAAIVAAARRAVLLALVACVPSGLAAGAAPAAVLAAHARAAIVADTRTGETLYAQHPDTRLPIASTTKLMTALLALDETRPTHTIVSHGYSPGPDEVTIGLHAGERMTVHDLLLALLLPSANDAAMTLARGLAADVPAFVSDMNSRAAALGLTGTAYANPIGLDEPGNHSTARDLAHLASYLLARPLFASIVDRPSARLTSGFHPRVVYNRNDLVGRVPFVDGVKTGHTTDAGYVLVAAAHAHGAQVVSVVLGEPNERAQDADSLSLLRYGLSRFKRIRALRADVVVAHAAVRYYGAKRIPLVAAHGVGTVGLPNAPVTFRVHAAGRLTGPLRRGVAVGSVTVLYAGEPLRTVALVTGERVPGAGLLRRLWPVGDAVLAALACLMLGGAIASWRIVRARRTLRRGGCR